MARQYNFFKPPFVVKDAMFGWVIENAKGSTMGMFGSKARAKKHCDELNKKYPVKNKR